MSAFDLMSNLIYVYVKYAIHYALRKRYSLHGILPGTKKTAILTHRQNTPNINRQSTANGRNVKIKGVLWVIFNLLAVHFFFFLLPDFSLPLRFGKRIWLCLSKSSLNRRYNSMDALASST
jgi:hypothetical protein